MSIGVVLVIIAIILVIIDIALGFRGTTRSWSLTPVAVLLVCIAIILGSGLIHS